ncbi:MAG: polysaccharide biosynthesis protein GtrA [Hyphomicrobiales bacterium]|nr:MAG: polysaccharide biosynthesis protein GtrA [Hyphomicrobiales bacterium]
MSILVKYSAFALFSTIINLLFQKLSTLIYHGNFELYIAMFAGTLAGLIAKYTLDKNFIFYSKPENKIEDSKKFILYSFTGLFTTLIFWGAEILFDHIFTTEYARYIGAIIGLTIGYICKYQLDKKYVFTEHTSCP